MDQPVQAFKLVFAHLSTLDAAWLLRHSMLHNFFVLEQLSVLLFFCELVTMTTFRLGRPVKQSQVKKKVLASLPWARLTLAIPSLLSLTMRCQLQCSL